MATSCLFAAAVIAVISTSNVHSHYGHKLFIIAPVSNQNGGKIYWSLHPIERRNRVEDQRCTEDDDVQTMNSKKHEDYSGDRLISSEDWNCGGRDRRYFEADGIVPRKDGTRTWDGRENLNEPNSHSHKRNPHDEHKVRNIKNDYVQWRKMRENKSLYEGYRSHNEEQLNDDDSLSGAVIKRGNRNRDQTILVWDNNLLADIGGSTIKKDDNMFEEDEMWQEQLGDEYLQRPLSKVRKKRSPKMTRSKIIKRQRRKNRRKEIRQQRKRMRIIKHDPEDDKFVASKEDKKPTITYDYSTHEERPKNDLDEEFVSKMPRRGELGEFGEGSDESDENKAKEVTNDDDKKKKKNKKDDDKEKKGGDKPKGRKDDKKPKGKKGGDRGKAKKSGSKKGGKKGKKERGRVKKKKAAGRDTKGKRMLTDRNLQHQHDAVNYGQHKSVDRSRASVANQRDVVRLQQNPLFAKDHVQQRSVTQEHHKTVFNQIRLSTSGNGIDHPQRFFQKQIGNADVLHSVANIKQITRNKEDTKIFEREKVLADFRKIFGQKNTVKLLMDKHQSRLNNNNINNNNNKASLHFANNNAVNY